MIKVHPLFVLLLASLSFSIQSNCQAISDSLFYQKATNHLRSVYFSSVQEKSHLYNGYEYEYFGRGATGSPFFLVDTMHPGDVFYDGILYGNIPMRYDLVNDELLVKYLKDNNTIRLIKNRVDYFSIKEHRFVRLDESGLNGNESSQFYELLHQDKNASVLARRHKKLMLSSNPEDRSSAFVQYDQYVLYRNEKYFVINSERDLANVFKDKAQDLKKFLRQSKLSYKKEPEQVIVNTAKYFTTLTK